MTSRQRGGVENILIWCTEHAGDVILLSPAIRELRMNYPFAYITLVVAKRVYPLMEHCPYVNEVLPFDTNFDFGNIIATMYNAANFAQKYLWRRYYDLALNLGAVGDMRLRSFTIYLSGTKRRVGYVREELDRFLYTDPVTLHGIKIASNCFKGIHLLETLGLVIRHTYTEVWYDKCDLLKAKKFMAGFAEGRIKVVVAIGAHHKERCYPLEKYLVAFKEIIAKGASIVIVGGPDEVEGARFLENNLPKEFVKNIVKLNPTWRVTSAIISLVDMYIGNDTGAQHVAAALNKPVVVLSRVAKDRKEMFPNETTELELFYSCSQTNHILLQPEHQLGDCHKKPHYAGCDVGRPHCITQIKPSEIVDAYEEMVYFMKYSPIKKTTFPPIVRSINPVSEWDYRDDFNKI